MSAFAQQFLDWWTADNAIATFTIVLGIATVVLAIATFWLAKSTERLVRLSESSTQDQLRAYIGIFQGHVELVPTGAEVEFQVYVEMKNSGQTPAYNFRTWHLPIFICCPNNVPIDLDNANGYESAGSSVGPGAVIFVQQNNKISNEDFQNIINGSKKLFFVGGAKYKDIFSRSQFFSFFCQASDAYRFDGQRYVFGLQPARDYVQS